MKKTAAILVLMLILISLSAGSFYVGTDGGVGFNSIISGKNYKGYSYGSASAYYLSVPVIYEFNEWTGIESAVVLSGRNYTLERYYQRSTVEDLRMNNVFVEVPILARFRTSAYDGLALFASVGGFLGYWAWGQQKGDAMGLAMTETTPVDQETELDRRNRFQAGVEASVGCTIDFSRLRVQFCCRYALTLTDLNLPHEKGGYPLHNSTFTVGCALMWRCF